MRDTAIPPPAEHLAHVDTWVFDLDNTLYPPETDLFTQVDGRITAWIAHHHGIDGLSARYLQKHYYQRYGTSLNGLMIEDKVDPASFLAFVHDIDHSAIVPNHRLGHAIDALPGRKFILTNGSRRHAEAVAERLGVDHLFEDIFDIEAAGFAPKPSPRNYEIFLDKFGLEPVRAAMFEDLARNLEVPHSLGMRTVLVVPAKPISEERRADWDAPGSDRLPHVDHTTSDLAGFLEGLPKPR